MARSLSKTAFVQGQRLCAAPASPTVDRRKRLPGPCQHVRAAVLRTPAYPPSRTRDASTCEETGQEHPGQLAAA